MDLEKKFLGEFLDDLDGNKMVLPTLPEIAIKVREVVNDPEASASQLAKIIRIDPVLSGRLLYVSNGPLYRSTEPIENIQTAIARMGLTVVKNIVTSIVMEQLYQADSTPGIRKQLEELWLHSTKVAAISNVLARKFTSLSPDQAMLAGLVHDIGVLPILTRAEIYPDLIEDKETLNKLITKLHTITGAAILEEWNFPQELVAVAFEHENLERGSGNKGDYVDLVIVANLHSYIGTEHPHAKVDWGNIPAFNKLGLTPDESIEAMQEARPEIKEIQGMLS